MRNPDGQQAVHPFNPTPAVQGTGFSRGTTVTIGGNPATVLSAGATAVSVRTPPGNPGPATVVLTTPGGCTATTTYTYL